MALRGSIADYGLADILQLLSQGQRSGVLRIHGEDRELVFGIRDGVVVQVESAEDAKELAQRILKAGLISDEANRWVVSEHRTTGRSVAELLVIAQLLDAVDVERQVDLHRWELLLSPFTWAHGAYEFDGTPLAEEPVIALPIDLVLMRGLRLVEDWPEARRRVPSRAWVVGRRLPLPANNAYEAGGPDVFGETQRPGASPLSDEARSMHWLAAPGVGVGALIDRAPYDRYEATFALSELIEAGLVVLTPP